MSKISFIYFDVGGVAIKDFSDTPKWNIMLDSALGISASDRDGFDKLYDQYEDDICLGKIAVDDIKPYIKERYNPSLSDSFSLLQYFVDNFEPNEGLWEIVRSLSSQVKLGLLTDQYLGMLDGIFAKNLIPPRKWHAIIDSSVEGVRKPMPEIYKLAQDRAGVPPAEILFIDNRSKNLVVPKEMGWQTYLYDSSNYDQANIDLEKFLTSIIHKS